MVATHFLLSLLSLFLLSILIFKSVIRTQKQLHDIENAKLIEEAVTLERNAHKQEVEMAIAKLGGIESALESRVGMDAEVSLTLA